MWRARAFEFGFTNDPTKPYAVDHNVIPDVARHLEWAYGVRFTKRKSRSDRPQVPNATPGVRA